MKLLFRKILSRFSHWFIGIRIRNKIFLSNFILISLIFVVIFVFSFSRVDNILFDQAQKEINSSLLQLKNNIENQLSQYQEVSKNVYYNQELLDQLTTHYKGNLDAYDGFIKSKTFLQTMQISDPAISAISIYVFNPSFLTDGSYFRFLDDPEQQEERIQELLHSNFGGVWLRTDQNSKGEYIIAFQRLLYEYKYSFQVAGILSIELPESALYSYIGAESNDKSFYILDGQGYVVTSSDRTMLEKNMEGGSFVSDVYQNDHGQFVQEINGHEELVAYYTLFNGWKLLAMTPLDIIKESIRKMNGFILAIYIAAIALLLVITYYLADVLTRRIKMLSRVVQLVEKGEYTHKVDLLGKDEVGQLASAYNQMTDQLEYMFHEVYDSKIRMKELELNALQSQINPHFLNNVLSSIGWLARKKGAQDVCQMVSETAKFYRFSLSVGNDIVTLAEELDQVQAYIEIQKFRFPDCIQMSIQVDEHLYTYELRKLTLQPLVENCINHGMREDSVPLHVCLRGFQDERYTVLEIEDDGMGIAADKLETLLSMDTDSGETETSLGIRNVNERIKLHFGKNYGLTMNSEVGKGTKVTIHLPLHPARLH